MTSHLYHTYIYVTSLWAYKSPENALDEDSVPTDRDITGAI